MSEKLIEKLALLRNLLIFALSARLSSHTFLRTNSSHHATAFAIARAMTQITSAKNNFGKNQTIRLMSSVDHHACSQSISKYHIENNIKNKKQ